MMIEEDGIRPRTLMPMLPDPEALSVSELEDHLQTLHGEIERVRAVLDRKRAYLTEADSVFRL